MDARCKSALAGTENKTRLHYFVMNELTPQQAMAMIEVRELLRLRDIDVDAMTDEEIVGFVNRGVQWIADMFPVHHPALNIILQMAQAKSMDATNTEAE